MRKKRSVGLMHDCFRQNKLVHTMNTSSSPSSASFWSVEEVVEPKKCKKINKYEQAIFRPIQHTTHYTACT